MCLCGPPRWVSGPWFFRDDRMYLIPGDSPMGYRLPLESLPWVSADRLSRTASARSVRAARAVARGVGTAHAISAALFVEAWWCDVRRRGGEGRRESAERPGTRQRPQPQRDQRQPARGESARLDSSRRLCAWKRAIRRARPARKVEAESFGSGRSLLHVFMPPLDRTRRLPRPARGHRSDSGRSEDEGGARRLSAAARRRV